MTRLSLADAMAGGLDSKLTKRRGINMRYAVVAFAIAIVGSTSAYAQHHIGEICSGKETIQVGTNAKRIFTYKLNFSADLASGYYCYADCKPEQTFPIKDRTSDPIKLTDLSAGTQTRKMTFNQKTGILTDYQTYTVLATTKRSVRAACRPAAFHQPTPLPGD